MRVNGLAISRGRRVQSESKWGSYNLGYKGTK